MLEHPAEFEKSGMDFGIEDEHREVRDIFRASKPQHRLLHLVLRNVYVGVGASFFVGPIRVHFAGWQKEHTACRSLVGGTATLRKATPGRNGARMIFLVPMSRMGPRDSDSAMDFHGFRTTSVGHRDVVLWRILRSRSHDWDRRQVYRKASKSTTDAG